MISVASDQIMKLKLDLGRKIENKQTNKNTNNKFGEDVEKRELLYSRTLMGEI